jgi:hypothetical protein
MQKVADGKFNDRIPFALDPIINNMLIDEYWWSKRRKDYGI